MELNKDYYQILGVEKTASQEDIKKAFRSLSKQHHPDVGGNEETFKEINNAYSVLSDEKQKQQYDIQSPNGANYQPNSGFQNIHFSGFGGPDFANMTHDEIIDFMMFGGRRRQQEFIENLDIQINVIVNLTDIYNNRKIDVKYIRMQHCEICGGTGFDPTSNSVKCEVCDGKGYDNYRITCKYCQGKGIIHTGTCTTCNGEKIMPKEVAFSLDNIYQIQDSMTQYLRGYGHYSKYYHNKRGNAVLNVIFKNDNRYERTNQGLLFNLNVHYQDAIDGFDYIHDHLDDKRLKIKIPPLTKDKDLIRIKEKGLLINATTRSNLLLRINVVIDYDRVKPKKEKKKPETTNQNTNL
jgi:molecular chaperone DnaJ